MRQTGVAIERKRRWIRKTSLPDLLPERSNNSHHLNPSCTRRSVTVEGRRDGHFDVELCFSP